MKRFVRIRVLLALGGALILSPSGAAVSAPQARAEQRLEAVVPFDPPLDRPLRYRYEKVTEKDGRTSMSWSLDEYRFTKAPAGYRLTVTPVSSGGGAGDPRAEAVYKKLSELSSVPYVLLLNEDGEITEFVDAERYWSTILNAVQEALAAPIDGKKLEPEVAAGLSQFLKLMRDTPAEVRLAKLTEAVQPIVEFGNTHLSADKPISLEVDTASPFGPVKQHVRVALNGVAGDVAAISIRSELPREQMEAMVGKLLGSMAASMPKAADPDAIKKGLADLEAFSASSEADYKVSTVDGLTVRYQSAQTVETREKGVTKRRVTTTSLQLAE